MKTHTSQFKQNISLMGKELDSIVTYELDNEDVELGPEELNSVTPHYESSILKSVMKQLDIDSNVEIPVGTILNYQFGVKVRDNEVEDYRDNYDYVDYGNYEVYSIEKQEDTNSYKIVCYDKMLKTMKDYENLEMTYPISVRSYIDTLCTHLGITFANSSDIFVNYDKNINKEFYLEYDEETEEYKSMGYTYRDVFDELAQVTASTIVINEDDELEIRYITDTEDTIDEEYLKDINVNFGEVYGPINSIVLSRSADTDFIFKQDDESIEENGLCEIKISDNQLLSLNNRADYLNGIYDQLNGLTYALNDFKSTGIAYYDVCDRYSVEVGDNTYSCVMFNDEVNVTQGLDEHIYTDRPEDSETDYSKSSKDQIRNNQTTLIVDKVNKEITAVVSEIGDRSSSQTTIAQDINSINERLESVAVISEEDEDDGILTMEGLAEISVVYLKVYPKGEYDLLNRYSAQHSVIGHYHINRPVIVFYNGDKSYQYELPRLYYYNNTYDEFILDNALKKAYIIHRIGFNQQNEKYVLPEEVEEELDINTNNWVIGEGTNTIFIPGYDGSQNRLAHIKLKAMLKNDLTSSFATEVYVDRSIEISEEGIMSDVSNTYATKTELASTETTLNSNITQAVSDREATINASVTRKLRDVADEDGNVTGASLVLAVNEEGSSVAIDADKININGVISANGNFQVDASGNMTCNNANINGNLVSSNGLYTNLQYNGKFYGWYAEGYDTNNSTWFLGYNFEDNYQTGVHSIIPSVLIAPVFIPTGFVVDKAYITIKHNPVTWTAQNNQTYRGYARNVKAYTFSGLDSVINASYMSEYDASTTLNATLISGNPMGSNGKTFSNSSSETYTSGNISQVFNGSGLYYIGVKTSDSTPSAGAFETDETYKIGPLTGNASMIINIYGWMQLR